jgi:hypothetical protein
MGCPRATREEALGSLGAGNIRTFVDQRDPQQVAVLMDVANVDSLIGALQSQHPDLRSWSHRAFAIRSVRAR